MVKTYSITKYNPIYRNENGVYEREEWTSICDIGKMIGGQILSKKDYLDVEESYVRAVELLLEYHGIDKLIIMQLEKHSNLSSVESSIMGYDHNIYSDEIIKAYHRCEEGLVIPKAGVNLYCKLILRENIWSILYSREIHFVVIFGYDYYMKVICPKISEAVIAQIESNGLFVEFQK